MADYKNVSPFDIIFGDFHYGVNASVEGAPKKLYGQPVVLKPGDVISVDGTIEHAHLEEVKSKVVKSSKKDDGDAIVTPLPVKPAK